MKLNPPAMNLQFCSHQRGVALTIVGLILSISSCDSFLDVAEPNSKIPSQLVFANDENANSAMIGVYINLYSAYSFAGGGQPSVAVLAGLSADELKNTAGTDPVFTNFEKNEISPVNQNLLTFWNSFYKSIYQCNAVLEGLSSSVAVTESTKKQLNGEASLVRAFCYFYLTNFFGDVPLALTTDYKINSALRRMPQSTIYEQIIADLATAENLLSETYPGDTKVRPNKSAATTLLARVFLYTGDWARAEEKSTKVIAQNTTYGLSNNLNDVFLANSSEAIWQLKPYDGAFFTNEGYAFSPIQASAYNILRDDIISVFEANDKRQSSWIQSLSSTTGAILLPYKYKKSTAGGVNNEYSMVIRLAELYLIRAEARVMLNKLDQALEDADQIRKRAGLSPLSEVASDMQAIDIIRAIEKERRIEFLSEWGHRWLDLKRWNRAVDVLSPLKPAFSTNDLLYPVPQDELRKNQNLAPQNAGY